MLDPTLVKAIIMEETKMGTYPGQAGQNGRGDIMQSNVWLSEESNDWGDYKENFGLSKRGSATPNESVYASIRILYMKGIKTEGFKNSSGMQVYKTSWKSKNGD